jgi:hypothetical protein
MLRHISSGGPLFSGAAIVAYAIFGHAQSPALARADRGQTPSRTIHSTRPESPENRNVVVPRDDFGTNVCLIRYGV